ncbi:MAG TPA: acyl carrier protein [Chitinophagaceae bacterium]|nr:acyl carrier protein [Chitinophagaceae bacterium]
MTSDQILQDVQEVFRETFGDPGLTIVRSTKADDIDLWDSMTHLELIAAIEKKFNLKFTFEQFMRFNNVGDMVSLIDQIKQSNLP